MVTKGKATTIRNINITFSHLPISTTHRNIALLQRLSIPMGITKTNLFTEEQNNLANLAKALGHPARIAVLQYLISTSACINNDLVAELGLAQATVSQHLKALKEAGLIQGSIDGNQLNYCINPKGWEQLSTEFKALFEAYDPTINNCTI